METVNLHIKMPKIGWKDTGKNNKWKMLFLCPYISERKYPTAIQSKTIRVNNFQWEKKSKSEEFVAEKKSFKQHFIFPLCGLVV